MEILSDVQLRNWIKFKQHTRGKADGGGLYFTLSEGGTAAWIFRFRYGGKQKEYTIGRYPDISLADARKQATRLRSQVNEGVDVSLEKRLAKQKQLNIETLNDIADEYISRQTHLKHPKVIRLRYTKHIRSTIGKFPVDRVTVREIDNLLQSIKIDAPTVANDVLRLLKRIFGFAVVLKHIPFNPAAELRTRDAGGKEKPRQRVLELDEITTLFSAMKNTPTLGRENELAIKLLLILGVRKSELLEARWSEVNLEEKIWRLPFDRSKNSKAFRIPLPDITIEWLRELKIRAYQSDYVFPARLPQERKLPHISPDTLNVALRRVQHNLDHFVIHDFRRTARTHLGRLNVLPYVAELCLNHQLKGITGVYDTNDYLLDRQKALNNWAGVIEKIDQGNVISIGKAKKLHRR